MKSDINGCSTCAAGTEQHETFRVRGRTFIQYDYRTPDGELFSGVFPTLDKCREARDKWLRDRANSAKGA